MTTARASEAGVAIEAPSRRCLSLAISDCVLAAIQDVAFDNDSEGVRRSFVKCG